MYLRDFVSRLFDVAPVGVPVDHHSGAALATKQVVDGCLQRLALDVPERHVDGSDRRHGHWPAPPVGAAIEILPNVFRLERIAPDQARDQMVGQVRRHGQLTAIQRGVAESVDAFVGKNLQT